MARRKFRSDLPLIGWREWVALPDLQIDAVKAKIDTGARTSCLHAVRVRTVDRDGRTFVTFSVHPLQKNSKLTVEAEAEVVEFRDVRSSNGQVSRRPVILTPVSALGQRWNVELTLANRDEMGFRMLLGREALRDRFLVDSGCSFAGGKPVASRVSQQKQK